MLQSFRTHKVLVGISIILVIMLLIMMIELRSTKKAESVKELYGLDAMSRFERLPYLQSDTFAGGASSYDRSGGNADGYGESNFLYKEQNGDKVMLDLKGSGTINRMWFTGFDPAAADLKVYFDGETTPRIHMPLHDLFTGTNAPFLSPLVADDRESSGGFVSYVPLSYSKSIKITTNGTGQSFYYNIGYHAYPPNAPVSTWNGSEDSTAVREMWNKAGADPKSDADNSAVSNTIRLSGGASAALLQIDGPRSISSIKLNIPGVVPGSDSQDILNHTRLKIYWDGESNPSVDAPIGSFFAMGQFGAFRTKAVPVGMDEHNTMYMYFPMPFAKKAKVELINEGSNTIDNIFYEIKHKPFRDSFDNVGYFKTRFTPQKAKSYDGSNLVILDEEGSGQFVGVVQSLTSALNQGPVDRWHLEGDEKVYVDDSQSPVIQGTGTEDFYNGGWYFNKGLYTAPMSGYTAFHIDNDIDSSAMYRLFVSDAIPFRKHIRVSIQHGADDEVTEDVWMLAFYYHKTNNRAVLTDTLDVGNDSSEKSHSYKIDKQTGSDSGKHQYEGASFGSEVMIQDDGRAFTGHSEFTMAIKPGNEGVILRRRFDQMEGNQSANIYVDDLLVGTWYKAGSNGFFNWRDEDFIIPAAFTKGKHNIRIKVEFVPTSQVWNEYRYSAYSLVP